MPELYEDVPEDELERREPTECSHCEDGDYYSVVVGEDGDRTGHYILCPYCKGEEW